MGKLEGMRPLGRHRHRWKDDVELDPRKMEWGGMNCINLAQDKELWRALVNAVLNVWVLQNIEKFLSDCANRGFSRRVT
jgi:hypothetical protein